VIGGTRILRNGDYDRAGSYLAVGRDFRELDFEIQGDLELLDVRQLGKGCSNFRLKWVKTGGFHRGPFGRC
jgi:hypothetical protein